MAILRRAIGLILLLGLSAVFIWSSYTKSLSLEPFTWSFLDILPVNFTGAAIIARLFIGLEWAIGAWLAAHVFLRRVTYKATAVLLLLLTAYLVALIIVQGNDGNCGCFGEWIYMSPSQAIWKNVALLAVVGALYFLYPSRPYKGALYAALTLGITAFTVPFVLHPVPIYGGGEKMREPITLDSLYTLGKPAPAVDLRQGKHVLCYFSSTCAHCKKAAYLVQILHRRYPELPIFMVVKGGTGMADDFMQESKSRSVPHTVLSHTPAFSAMAGRYVPAIYWVNNSIIERKTHYAELEPAALREWLKR